MFHTRYVLQAGLLVLALGTSTLAGCKYWPGSGDPTPPPQTVIIDAFTSFPALAGAKCTTNGTDWGVTPLAVPAGSGRSTALTERSGANEWFPSGNLCVLQHTFTNLQPGRWQVWVRDGIASGKCEASFQAGHSTV